MPVAFPETRGDPRRWALEHVTSIKIQFSSIWNQPKVLRVKLPEYYEGTRLLMRSE
jgi:hypothetical protein